MSFPCMDTGTTSREWWEDKCEICKDDMRDPTFPKVQREMEQGRWKFCPLSFGCDIQILHTLSTSNLLYAAFKNVHEAQSSSLGIPSFTTLCATSIDAVPVSGSWLLHFIDRIYLVTLFSSFRLSEGIEMNIQFKGETIIHFTVATTTCVVSWRIFALKSKSAM